MGGLWNCLFPLPFIMCNFCPLYCAFGQIRSWLFLGILGSNFLIGRAFCGFFCPGGVIQDLLFKIPLKKITIPQRLDLQLRYLKYGFGILMIALIIEATKLWRGLPLMEQFWSFLIRYIDEVRILLIGGIIFFLILAIFIGRSWCRYFCPLGAWLSVFNKYSLFVRRGNPERCTGCSLCNRRCSALQNPLGSQSVWSSLECVRCLQCYSGCKEKVFDIQLRK